MNGSRVDLHLIVLSRDDANKSIEHNAEGFRTRRLLMMSSCPKIPFRFRTVRENKSRRSQSGEEREGRSRASKSNEERRGAQSLNPTSRTRYSEPETKRPRNGSSRRSHILARVSNWIKRWSLKWLLYAKRGFSRSNYRPRRLQQQQRTMIESSLYVPFTRCVIWPTYGPP